MAKSKFIKIKSAKVKTEMGVPRGGRGSPKQKQSTGGIVRTYSNSKKKKKGKI
jgi:hypothetical protein